MNRCVKRAVLNKMFIQLLQRYSLKMVFALTLLVGLQLPNFLQQYEQRLDAHYIEAEMHLQQYQALADRHFAGDLQALIIKHKSSELALFNQEALLIEKLQRRFHYLQAKKQALQSPLMARLYFLLGEINRPLWLETQANYNAELRLNKNSIQVGLLSALVVTLFLECLFFLLHWQCRRLRGYFIRKRQSASEKIK